MVYLCSASSKDADDDTDTSHQYKKEKSVDPMSTDFPERRNTMNTREKLYRVHSEQIITKT